MQELREAGKQKFQALWNYVYTYSVQRVYSFTMSFRCAARRQSYLGTGQPRARRDVSTK